MCVLSWSFTVCVVSGLEGTGFRLCVCVSVLVYVCFIMSVTEDRRNGAVTVVGSRHSRTLWPPSHSRARK